MNTVENKLLMDTHNNNKANPKMAELEQAFFESEDHVDREYYEKIVKQYPYQNGLRSQRTAVLTQPSRV